MWQMCSATVCYMLCFVVVGITKIRHEMLQRSFGWLCSSYYNSIFRSTSAVCIDSVCCCCCFVIHLVWIICVCAGWLTHSLCTRTLPQSTHLHHTVKKTMHHAAVIGMHLHPHEHVLSQTHTHTLNRANVRTKKMHQTDWHKHYSDGLLEAILWYNFEPNGSMGPRIELHWPFLLSDTTHATANRIVLDRLLVFRCVCLEMSYVLCSFTVTVVDCDDLSCPPLCLSVVVIPV